MQKALVGVAALLASAEAFSPAAAPRAVSTRAVSPVMSEEGVTTRRALLAAVVLGAPAAANAMAVCSHHELHAPSARCLSRAAIAAACLEQPQAAAGAQEI